ncbi:nitrite reductase/ring-hydroxylating ferredoxin subunit [Kribbella voronezhensis]|uniref:Cytochrome bc1 complex Rieske iron-sulfur subunit n=1 Tax=Kribbella voronezhensis TaxID=2512212 RepID=A0A4R7SXU0_9ACTN|nr:Rieske (2Fe-2S) protein [Kribbella voronezhensis]TDU84101.1 nitrite reductase/ring-hydroxylating ferredoxin subunit [Kribbella voronezhensis]
MSDDSTAELGRAIETLRDRRAVLRGAGVAGLAGVGLPVLAACGGDSKAGGTASDPTSAPSSAPSSGPSSSAPTTGGGGSVLGPVSDVPVGGGKVFTDAKIVVTQPTAGQFKAFTAVCTHAGCLVATVENKTIDCPCHGSKYSVADGSVVNGPAPSPLAPVNVTVKGGNIVGPAA